MMLWTGAPGDRYFADEILEIPDDSSRDWKKRTEPRHKVDGEHIVRPRLMIATRKRILAWMAPRKYRGNPLSRA
jgi:hypothetical protein